MTKTETRPVREHKENTVFPNAECPRYIQCSINNCPLYPEYPDLFTSPYDAEKKCTISKTIRLRIAAKYPGILRFGGMKIAEYKALEAWNARTPEVKARFIAGAKKNAFVSVSQSTEKVVV